MEILYKSEGWLDRKISADANGKISNKAKIKILFFIGK
jgi:hypothetical protein